jgi:SAM-dependent methyltransferase
MTRHAQPADLRDYLHHALSTDLRTQVRTHLDGCEQCWSDWNRFRWDQARSTSLHADLAEFLGDDFRPYFDSSRALAQEWDIANPRTNGEIRDFFRASTSYLYNLVIWEASGNRPDYLTAALPILHRFRPRNIVDYGCGIGSDSLALRNNGFTVIQCDFHSPSTAFLRWRASRAGATLDVIEPHELSVIADTVWIIDTLDHITDLDQELGPLLRTARLVICEHLAASRTHGRQRFHHRRTPEHITGIFSRYGFARAEQPGETRSAPITVWRDVRPSTGARAALLSSSVHGEHPRLGRPCPATQRLRPGLGAQRHW